MSTIIKESKKVGRLKFNVQKMRYEGVYRIDLAQVSNQWQAIVIL
jgi:hypothetical protein